MIVPLGHPIRVAIIDALAEHGTLTPKAIAGQVGLPVENVAYHVRMLKQAGLIELVDERAVRGAVEHHYRFAAGAALVLARALEAQARRLRAAAAAAEERSLPAA